MQAKIALGTFDVVLTNPPFGAKIAVKGPSLLAQYELGHKWRREQQTGEWTKTATLPSQQPPQLLFLERCLQLLKPGGRLGIVLPESLVSNPSYTFVLRWARQRARIKAVVAMPEALFKTSGKGGTHTKVCLLVLEKFTTYTALSTPQYDIFMAEAKWCGHDSRANPTIRKDADGRETLLDDVPEIGERYRAFRDGRNASQDHLGFWLNTVSLTNDVLIPKYYDPELAAHLVALQETHDVVTVGDLVAQRVLSIATGWDPLESTCRHASLSIL